MTHPGGSVFEIEPRGVQDASWAKVTMEDGRARIAIEYEGGSSDFTEVKLTRTQTAELAGWLLDRLHVA